jgi:hypothetical protein
MYYRSLMGWYFLSCWLTTYIAPFKDHENMFSVLNLHLLGLSQYFWGMIHYYSLYSLLNIHVWWLLMVKQCFVTALFLIVNPAFSYVGTHLKRLGTPLRSASRWSPFPPPTFATTRWCCSGHQLGRDSRGQKNVSTHLVWRLSTHGLLGVVLRW